MKQVADNRNHYIYRITNIKEKKYYYGSRVTDIEPKLDLGVKYFSSSTDKEFIKDQHDNPQNYKYKVIRVFDNSIDKQKLESYLHNKFNVKSNSKFYNKANQTMYGFDTTGTIPWNKGLKKWLTIDGDHRRKISEGVKEYYKYNVSHKKGVKGKPHTEEHKKRMSDMYKDTVIVTDIRNNENIRVSVEEFHEYDYYVSIHKGKKVSEKTKKKLSIAAKNRTPEHIRKISESLKGRKLSETQKLNHSNLMKGKGNSRALKINIYNNEDELMYKTHGNFKQICRDNELPVYKLRYSYKNNDIVTYSHKPRNEEHIKYIGWYARIIDDNK